MFLFQSLGMSFNISHRYSHFYRMLVKTQFLIMSKITLYDKSVAAVKNL